MGPDQNGGPFFVYCAGPVVWQYMAPGDKATALQPAQEAENVPWHMLLLRKKDLSKQVL